MEIGPVARSRLASDVGLKTPSVERIFERNDFVSTVDLTLVVQKTPSGCARYTSSKSHRCGMDIEKTICNLDSLDKWLKCQERKVQLRLTCVKKRRTSARHKYARARTRGMLALPYLRYLA